MFISELLPLYVSGSDSIQKAHALFGSAENLLRGTTHSLRAGAGNRQGLEEIDNQQEISSLKRFAQKHGLMLDAAGVRSLMSKKPIPGGMEHKVSLVGDRVLKSYDTASSSGDVFFVSAAAPTKSLFDYLTDFQLANHFFSDDVRIEGVFNEGDSFHILISQPFVKGKHPADKDAVVEGAQKIGLLPEREDIANSRFRLDGGPAGILIVSDFHEDNGVINKQTGLLHPIDVHFRFPDKAARIKALNALGLWESNTGQA